MNDSKHVRPRFHAKPVNDRVGRHKRSVAGVPFESVTVERRERALRLSRPTVRITAFFKPLSTSRP